MPFTATSISTSSIPIRPWKFITQGRVMEDCRASGNGREFRVKPTRCRSGYWLQVDLTISSRSLGVKWGPCDEMGQAEGGGTSAGLRHSLGPLESLDELRGMEGAAVSVWSEREGWGVRCRHGQAWLRWFEEGNSAETWTRLRYCTLSTHSTSKYAQPFPRDKWHSMELSSCYLIYLVTVSH